MVSRLLVVGIRLQHCGQDGSRVVAAPVAGQKICPDRVGLRIGQRRHLQQRWIDRRRGTVHVEVHVPCVADVVFQRRLQLLQIAERLLRRSSRIRLLLHQ